MTHVQEELHAAHTPRELLRSADVLKDTPLIQLTTSATCLAPLSNTMTQLNNHARAALLELLAVPILRVLLPFVDVPLVTQSIQ